MNQSKLLINGAQPAKKRTSSTSSKKSKSNKGQAGSNRSLLRKGQASTKGPDSVGALAADSPSKKEKYSPMKSSPKKTEAQKLGSQQFSGSFVLSSTIQKVPFSNSNKQVHLRVVNAERTISHKMPKIKGLKVRTASLSDSDSEFEDDPFMQRLKRDYPSVMQRSITSSPRRYASAQSHMEPPKQIEKSKGGEETKNTRHSSGNTLSWQSVEEKYSRNRSPAVQTTETGLYSEAAVKRVLEYSAATISCGDQTIGHVRQLSARNSKIRGSTNCIDEQMKHMSDIVDQIQNGIVNDKTK